MHPVLLLLLASIALLVGPLLSLLGARSRALRELIDGFALVVIAGICLLVVLPHVVGEIGLAAVVLATAGVLLPTLAHRLGGGPRWSLLPIAPALIAHVLFDGAVLSLENESELLGWAVVAHRLPAGFAVVLAAQASPRPRWTAWGIALAMILATVAGFIAGPSLLAGLPPAGTAGLEALVAGVLLHVAFVPHHPGADHHHHHHQAHHGQRDDNDHQGNNDHLRDENDHQAHHDHHEPAHHHPHGSREATTSRGWAASGALFGLLALGGASRLGHHDVEHAGSTFLETLGVLVFESAPALLLGYALAGVIPLLLTPARTTALGRGGKLAQSLRGVAFGLPLPVCSCGVLPLYESLIRRGAPVVAAMAFFVATT